MAQEFKDGQEAYGYEGLCVRAEKTEEGSAKLHLYSSDNKGKMSKQVVLAEHCAEVDSKAKKLRALFDFKRQSHAKKVEYAGQKWHD